MIDDSRSVVSGKAFQPRTRITKKKDSTSSTRLNHFFETFSLEQTMKFSAACLLILASPTAAFMAQSRAANFRPLAVVTDPTTEARNGVESHKQVEEVKKEETLKVEVSAPSSEKEDQPKKEEPKLAPVKETKAGALEP